MRFSVSTFFISFTGSVYQFFRCPKSFQSPSIWNLLQKQIVRVYLGEWPPKCFATSFQSLFIIFQKKHKIVLSKTTSCYCVIWFCYKVTPFKVILTFRVTLNPQLRGSSVVSKTFGSTSACIRELTWNKNHESKSEFCMDTWLHRVGSVQPI